MKRAPQLFFIEILGFLLRISIEPESGNYQESVLTHH